MATDLHCPNCDENLGKDTENPERAGCGRCGEQNIRNPYGFAEAYSAQQKRLNAGAPESASASVFGYEKMVEEKKETTMDFTKEELLLIAEGLEVTISVLEVAKAKEEPVRNYHKRVGDLRRLKTKLVLLMAKQ